MVILMDQPLRMIVHRPNTLDRVAKWALDLFEFDLVFHLRPSIKVHVLANFVTKCTIFEGEPEGDSLMEEDQENQLVIYVDGSSNANGSGAGLILTSLKGNDIQYALHFGFLFTNNEVKYEALIAGLKISKEMVGQL